jgi:hypothetical protein
MTFPSRPGTAGDPDDEPQSVERAGFDVIEEQQPSFLFERSVLVTGEVPRTTGYELGHRILRPLGSRV